MTVQRVFGFHAVEALLRFSAARVTAIRVLRGREDARLQAVCALADQAGIAVHHCDRRQLDQYADGAVHQGLIAEAHQAEPVSEAMLCEEMLPQLQRPLLLILDGVTDPHNLGACIRSADALGAHALIVPKDNSATLNATVRKVACGAAEVVPLVTVKNLARMMRKLQDSGIWIVGTAGEAAQSLGESDLTGPVAIAMGAEGAGLRRLTREHCDFLVRIPLLGSVSSLNVSVATGICLYEAARQRAVATP